MLREEQKRKKQEEKQKKSKVSKKRKTKLNQTAAVASSTTSSDEHESIKYMSSDGDVDEKQSCPGCGSDEGSADEWVKCTACPKNWHFECTDVRLKCKGMAQAHWSEGSGDNRQSYGDRVVYIDSIQHIFGQENGELTRLLPGRSTIDFDFTLPSILPMSFVGAFATGSVQYWLKAYLRKVTPLGNTDQLKVKRFFVVGGQPLDLNNVPNAPDGVVASDEKVPCCMCGSLAVQGVVRLDKYGYVPGENIVVNAEIDDRPKAAPEGSAIRLIRETTFRTHGGAHVERKEFLGADIHRGPIPAGGSCVYLGEILPVPLDVQYTSGQPCCSLMDVQYYVELHVNLPCSCFDLLVRAPIVIGSIPIRTLESQPQAAQGISPLPDPHMGAPPSYAEVMQAANSERGNNASGLPNVDGNVRFSWVDDQKLPTQAV